VQGGDALERKPHFADARCASQGQQPDVEGSKQLSDRCQFLLATDERGQKRWHMTEQCARSWGCSGIDGQDRWSDSVDRYLRSGSQL
jgi:hypothetical protein